MVNAHTFLVPSYYPMFRCKCGACRSTCCEGWEVTISLQEYFKLMGEECSPALRRRLDSAIKPLLHPQPGQYACIDHKWDGRCPLQEESGLCALHAECGEKALSAVCRYYPRSPRLTFGMECACANSCEGVLELLFATREPLTFLPMALEFELPKEVTDEPERAAPGYAAIRKRCVALLQSRERALPERLHWIGGLLLALTDAVAAADEAAAERIAREWQPEEALPLPMAGEVRADALNAARVLLWRFAAFNEAIVPLAQKIDAALGFAPDVDIDVPLPDGSVDRYNAASARFAALLPHWQRLFEQMLVNHVFYEGFPFSDRQELFADEYDSLCAVYALCRLLAVCLIGAEGFAGDALAALTDAMAALFRLIEHTSFDRNAAVLLHRERFCAPEQLALLLTL